MTTIIVAYSKNKIIGNKGSIPWHYSKDLKFFKLITMNNVVIMGRKTWDSIPNAPLKNRINIIVSKSSEVYNCQNKLKDVFYEYDLNSAIEFANAAFPEKKVFIIGGGEIYKQAIEGHYANRIIATEVKSMFEGDTYFPDFHSKSKIYLKHSDEFDIVEYKL